MTSTPGAERSRRIAALFDRVAETYEAVDVPWFAPIAERLVREVDPQPGERVLDVGCGRGAALFPVAEAVGASGAVTGIDLSPEMVAATQREVASRSLPQVQLHVMDAAAPDLPPHSYDAVTSSLVLFFLPEPLSALASWRLLLKSGGRIGVSTFGAQDPRWMALDELFVPYLPPQLLDARTSGASGPFATDQGTAQLLSSAGFEGVRTVGFEVEVDFSEVTRWERFSWSHGQRAMWEAVPEPARARVRDAAYELLDGYRDADGRIVLTQQVRLTLGRRI